MLRITVGNECGSTTMKLEGRLAGPWVEEVERTWQAVTPSPLAARVLVDLCAVTTVDSRGKELLARMHQSGVDLTASGPMTKYIIEEATRNQGRGEKEED